MGTGIFIMAIMGCGDAGAQCTAVTTVPTTYASREACMAATDEMLGRHDSLDFPTIVAECRASKAKGAAAPAKAPTQLATAR